jgi:leucyl/phenylalanyl-tRNA--protein transferase
MKLRLPPASALVTGPEEVTWSSPAMLTVENLRAAYSRGVFPWPGYSDEAIPWCCPELRAILVFAELKPGRTLEKVRRRNEFTCTIDRNFPAVIAACAAAFRPGQQGTWISPAMENAYTELHRAGYAHSVEVWQGAELVGGLYGVDAGGVFCGESMFHRVDNASKLGLLHLVSHLQSRGATWMDIQQLTPHLERLGAREIPRREFLTRFSAEIVAGRKLFG